VSIIALRLPIRIAAVTYGFAAVIFYLYKSRIRSILLLNKFILHNENKTRKLTVDVSTAFIGIHQNNGEFRPNEPIC